MSDYFIIDIETAPIDIITYQELNEEERLKKLNPIDSRIIAIGLRYNNTNYIFNDNDEKNLIEKFWQTWRLTKRSNPSFNVVGFNVSNFDIPFLITRSFINDIVIEPFTLKEIIDIKDKMSAYRTGPTRGKLKEIAKIVGIEVTDITGSDVPNLYAIGRMDEIVKYLEKDLEITDKLYERLVRTNISKIARW